MREKPLGRTLGGAADLIVIAPIKPGLIQSYEAVTPATRMAVTLRTLAAIRTVARESAPINAFADPVDQLELIQSFRIAILPDPDRMLLAVTFDHSWETYMRALWRGAGPLLDLIMTHCEAYPLARTATLAEWSAWVRAHEAPGEFFYSAAPLTVGDLGYLAQVEQAQRHAADAAAGDLAVAGLMSRTPDALAAAGRAAGPQPVVNQLGGSLLASMFRLTRYFGADASEEDARTLLVATRSLLDDWTPPDDLMSLAPAGAWLRSLGPQPQPPVGAPPAAIDRADVQKGVLSSFDQPTPMTHGALLFLSIVDPAAAAASLAGLALAAEAGEAPAIYRTLALTFGGMKRLGVDEASLAAFPPEFRQGAEARAGRLGDVRSFHPQNWRRPPRNWPSATDGTIDLSAIDAIIQLRTAATGNDAYEIVGEPGHPLHAEVTAMARLPGVRLLGVQAMRRRGLGSDDVNHFGFRDGISQPAVATGDDAGTDPADIVAPGELLLGQPDARGDAGSVPAFLRNGSFVAMRRMRMDRGAYEAMREAAADAAGLTSDLVEKKLLGRAADGTPVIAGAHGDNGFDYARDENGAACPLQAHVRRANPRTPGTPRIKRGGMAFGPPEGDGERGLIFMAYCASLAEQYEVLQQWVNGGNSTRIASALPDPIVGPAQGAGDVFRFLHDGQPHRVRLASAHAPIVTLDWMVYAFLPSLATVRSLGAIAPPAAAPQGSVERGEQLIGRLRALGPDGGEAWQALLTDAGARQTGQAADFWAAVRERHGGVVQSPLGILVGTRAPIQEVLTDPLHRYSVCGYDDRFGKSVGPIYLGFDPDDPRYVAQAGAGNAAIATIDRDTAFERAFAVTSGALRERLGPRPLPVDILSELVDPVMAALCQAYFGLPDGKHVVASGLDWRPPTRAACPGNLYPTTRYVFEPIPSTAGAIAGQAHGRVLAGAVLDWLNDTPSATGLIGDRLAATAPYDRDIALRARTLAGIMTGFAPVTVGNFANILSDWIASGELFRAQEDWLAEQDEQVRRTALESRIAAAMQLSPAPDFLWRTATETHFLGDVAIAAGERVLLCLQSATQGEVAAGRDGIDLVFGGRRGSGQPAHACPGRAMGMGTLLGIFAGLFASATMRVVPAPLTLELSSLRSAVPA